MRQWMFAVILSFRWPESAQQAVPAPSPENKKTVALAMNVTAPSVGSAGKPSGSQTGSAAARAGCGHRRCPQALRWHAPYVGRSWRTPSSPACTPIWPQSPGPLR